LIADTAFIIVIMGIEPAAVRKAAEIEKSSGAISVGSPTIFELWVGLSLCRKPREEREKIARVLESLPGVALDFPSAAAGGIIYGDREKAGLRIDPEDAMIAGIAKTRNERVITRNIKHFSGIEGITIETY